MNHMKRTALARDTERKWHLLEDRVDIDSEYYVDPSQYPVLLVFAQESRENDEGVAF